MSTAPIAALIWELMRVVLTRGFVHNEQLQVSIQQIKTVAALEFSVDEFQMPFTVQQNSFFKIHAEFLLLQPQKMMFWRNP